MLPPTKFYAELERIANERNKPAYGLDSIAIFHLTQALGIVMSEVSEDTWSAGWLSGCEDLIPHYAAQGTIDEAETLLALAKILGHWANYHYDGKNEYYLPYIPQAVNA